MLVVEESPTTRAPSFAVTEKCVLNVSKTLVAERLPTIPNCTPVVAGSLLLAPKKHAVEQRVTARVSTYVVAGKSSQAMHAVEKKATEKVLKTVAKARFSFSGVIHLVELNKIRNYPQIDTNRLKDSDFIKA